MLIERLNYAAIVRLKLENDAAIVRSKNENYAKPLNLYSPNSLLIILMIKRNILVLKIREIVFIQKLRNLMYSTENLKWNKIFRRMQWNVDGFRKTKNLQSSKFNYLSNGVGFIKIG